MNLFMTILLATICVMVFAAVVGSFVLSWQIVRDMGK